MTIYACNTVRKDKETQKTYLNKSTQRPTLKAHGGYKLTVTLVGKLKTDQKLVGLVSTPLHSLYNTSQFHLS